MCIEGVLQKHVSWISQYLLKIKIVIDIHCLINMLNETLEAHPDKVWEERY